MILTHHAYCTYVKLRFSSASARVDDEKKAKNKVMQLAGKCQLDCTAKIVESYLGRVAHINNFIIYNCKEIIKNFLPFQRAQTGLQRQQKSTSNI